VITPIPKKFFVAIMMLDLYTIGAYPEVGVQLMGFVSYLLCATILVCKIRAGE